MSGKESAAVWEDIERLVPWDQNPRHNLAAIESVMGSIKRFGFGAPIVARQEDRMVIAGHTRLEAAKRLGLDRVPVRYLDLDPADAKMLALADNKIGEIAEWDDDNLIDLLREMRDNELDVDVLGWQEEELDALIFSAAQNETDSDYSDAKSGMLSELYIVPPFSVLDARSGRWQDRKKFWKDLGILSNKGRKESLISDSSLMREIDNGTSTFDPVLCEIIYSWFSSMGSTIFDPFAGGSVRGIVASKLEREYIGVDIRQEQIDENWEQAKKSCADYMPKWICSDSRAIDIILPNMECDFIFTCPPYHDLETYSDLEKDISNMDYDQFIVAYKEIINKSCRKLKDNRFAAFVVGEVRDKKGFYKSFVNKTIEAFEEAGLLFYNEIILLTAIGTLALRAGKQFKASRKVGKSHQNILVFVKGDPKLATDYCGEVAVLESEEIKGNRDEL